MIKHDFVITPERMLLICICCVCLVVISTFFFVETVKAQNNTTKVIDACNYLRNQIADDYDFNLIEYDLNKSQKVDFNLMNVLDID